MPLAPAIFPRQSPIIAQLLRQGQQPVRSPVGAVNQGLAPILAALLQRSEQGNLQEALGGIFEAPVGQGQPVGGSPLTPPGVSRENLGLEQPIGLPLTPTPEGRVPRGPAIDPNSRNGMLIQQLIGGGSPQAQQLGQQLLIAELSGQQGDPFTLGSGDVRFNAQNQEVARGAPGGGGPVRPGVVDGQAAFVQLQDGSMVPVPGATPQPTEAMVQGFGNSLPGRAFNMLVDLAPKILNGTATDIERQQYTLAFQKATEPRTILDPTTGNVTTITPNLGNAFPHPSIFADPNAPRNISQPPGAPPSAAAPQGAPETLFDLGQENVGGQVRLSDIQRKNAGFGQRMILSNDILTRALNDPSFDPASIETGVINALPEFVANLMRSQPAQTVQTQQREFVRAVLRKESGAVISEQEFIDEATKFFPQVGDTQETIDQKAQLRLNAIQSMIGESGRGLEQLFPDEFALFNRPSPEAMQQRLNQIEAEVRQANPGASDDQLRQQILDRARGELGVGQ